MGKLMNPGPGELQDRASILALKIAHAGKGRETGHWEEELAACLALQQRFSDDHLDWAQVPAVTREEQLLAATNAKLWYLEEKLRYYRAHRADAAVELATVAELALELGHANDERDCLIAEINRLFGVGGGPEKVR